MNEASGLILSKLRPKTFIWTNDSGLAPELIATNLQGEIIRKVELRDFPNKDFEALSIGSCPDSHQESCVFVADIGDNRRRKSEYRIGVFREKDFWEEEFIRPVHITEFRYPSGSENAESLVILPDGDFLTFTKDLVSSKVVKISKDGTVTIVRTLDLLSLAGLSGVLGLITDASLSSDGKNVLVLTYSDLIEISLADLLSDTPLVRDENFTILKGPRLPQQETVTYTSADSFVVSTESEAGGKAHIVTYQCLIKSKGAFHEN